MAFLSSFYGQLSNKFHDIVFTSSAESWKVKQSREISAQPKILATLTNRNSREPDDYSLKIVQIKIALTI